MGKTVSFRLLQRTVQGLARDRDAQRRKVVQDRPAQ
jgi:hypothetical protein